MRILLVHPLKRGRQRYGEEIKPYLPPLALPTIAGLTPEDVEVRICDESVEEVDLRADADLIGITGISSQINRGYAIADAFRKNGKKVVMGGIHVSAMPDEAQGHADSILIGEAEDVWKEMIEDCRSGCLKERYQPRDYPDLKARVIPQYDLLKLDRYRRSTGSRLPRIPIQASRGCPFNCNFCSVTRFWGPRIRMKPLENMEAELSNIKRLGTNRVFLTDDNLIANSAYAESLMELLRKGGFSWSCQVSTNIQENERLIFKMAEAGCTAVYVGIETFSAQNLGALNKQFNTKANYERLLALFSRAGIRVTASMIIGMDGDTKESLEKMAYELIRMKLSAAQFYLLMLLPGTKIRDQFLDQNRIADDNWDHQDGTAVTFVAKNFQRRDLETQYWKLYKRFYSYRSILKRIVNWNNLKKGLRYVLIPLRANLYFRRRIKKGLHPFEN